MNQHTPKTARVCLASAKIAFPMVKNPVLLVDRGLRFSFITVNVVICTFIYRNNTFVIHFADSPWCQTGHRDWFVYFGYPNFFTKVNVTGASLVPFYVSVDNLPR